MTADNHAAPNDELPAPNADAKRLRGPILVGIGGVIVLVLLLYLHARSQINRVSLAQAPKPVTTVKAQATTFRPVRSYVGTTDPWNMAKVGPQYISVYVGAVLVRPGAIVKRGDVLATLDCRNASAGSREIAARAKAIEERQVAVAHETARVKELTQGGFASANEVEQLGARASAESAEAEGMRATLMSKALEVSDCILRAPFDGEVAERYVDPGSFVKPSSPVVSIVDRSIVRISADAPESDFTVVAPNTPVDIEIEATKVKITAKISRRAPAADAFTRTVHFEIDVTNADRAIPAGATARLTIHVGTPTPASAVPLRTATIRGEKASLYIVSNGLAKRTVVPVLGERGGTLYLDPTLAGGSEVVVEGRALLDDGDRVQAKEISP